MIRIACIQVGAKQDRHKTLKKVEKLLAMAASKGAKIACLPELTVDQFFPQYFGQRRFFKLAEPLDGKTVQTFRELAKKYHIAVIPNIYERVGNPANYYDTSLVIDAKGKVLGSQQMMHIAEDPTEDEKFYYQPGKSGYNVFPLRGLRLGIAICYDRHFPEQMRLLSLNGAEIIFVPTATTGLHRDAWEVEARASAIVNGIFVVHANKVGKEGDSKFFGRSIVVGPKGNLIARASEDREEVLIADIDSGNIAKIRKEWPFLRDRRPETYTGLTKTIARKNKTVSGFPLTKTKVHV